MTLRNSTKLPVLRYLGNVLCIWSVRAIPTYRVWLYDYYVLFADSEIFCLRDMALFACHHDQCMALKMILDITANYIVYEPLARNDDNKNCLGLTFRLDG